MKKQAWHKPGRRACRVLVLDLFITTLFALALLLSFLDELEAGNVFAYRQYMAYLEYIFAGITISFGSFVLVEVLETDKKQR